ncbi:hypothetical protein, partial [Faecalimicrobium dakarense]|uniref:hypothetical protein n=1 Tax=Faecalimicrobium dakarense TaxID=1301100 RepID=UPI0005A8C589
MKQTKKNINALKCSDIYDDEFENLLEEDLKDIEEFLDTYIVKTVEEEKIEKTIDILREYIPNEVKAIHKKQEFISILDNIRNNIGLLKLQISLFSKLYIMLSLLLVLCGVVSIINLNLDVYTSLSIIAPIPMILGMYEIMKGREENVWELELSYKYSFREIILSKLIIIEGFSVIIGLAMSIILFKFNSGSNILKITSSWLIPLCIMTSILLLMSSLFRNTSSIGLSIGIWVLGSTMISSNTSYEVLEISNIALIFILVASIILMTISLKIFYKRTINY